MPVGRDHVDGEAARIGCEHHREPRSWVSPSDLLLPHHRLFPTLRLVLRSWVALGLVVGTEEIVDRESDLGDRHAAKVHPVLRVHAEVHAFEFPRAFLGLDTIDVRCLGVAQRNTRLDEIDELILHPRIADLFVDALDDVARTTGVTERRL